MNKNNKGRKEEVQQIKNLASDGLKNWHLGLMKMNWDFPSWHTHLSVEHGLVVATARTRALEIFWFIRSRTFLSNSHLITTLYIEGLNKYTIRLQSENKIHVRTVFQSSSNWKAEFQMEILPMTWAWHVVRAGCTERLSTAKPVGTGDKF